MLAAFAIAGARSAPGAPVRTMPADPPSLGPCSGDLPADGVTGTVTVVGGSLGSGWADGRTLDYTFDDDYRTFYVGNFTVLSEGCSVETGAATTAGNGSFAFVPEAPTSTCVPNGTICTAYYAPQAPVYLSFAGGLPAGYAQNASAWYPPITLQVIDELSDVTISSASGSFVTSVGAPLNLSAAAWAANGTASPLPTSESWTLSGTGWSFVGPSTGASASVQAVPGAGAGTVTVVAQASSHGTELPNVTASASVTAVATTIESGETNRTSVDAGSSVSFELTAVGAAGFSYSATVDPGLGLAEVAAPCTSLPGAGGTVDLTCRTGVVYPSAGTAQPTAIVSNGYSAGSWRFPNVEVSAPPELEVSPGAPVGYARTPIALTVAAANGSGAMPYQRACLDPGDGQITCEVAGGPSWSFEPTLNASGTFDAVAWAVDADGGNASTSFTITVVPSLDVGPVTLVSGTAEVGSEFELRANLTGGVAPLRYWWNASGASGPLLDGSVSGDAPLDLSWVASAAGALDVTLTVVDALGSEVASSDLVDVGPAPAARIAVVTAAPAAPVTVGTPFSLSWGAYTAVGAVDAEFDAPLVITVGAPTAAVRAWVNSSGAGPLAALGNGSYGVPAAAWVDGLLSVNVTLATATNVTVNLTGDALPSPVAPVRLVSAPDLQEVRLFAPTVVRAGARSNATLWRVEDPYGNAAPGARLTVVLDFGSVRSEVVVAAIPLPGGASGLWVNFSAPTSGAGVLTVADAAGATVLGPIAVPAAPAASPVVSPIDAFVTVVPAVAAGVAVLTVVRRRRRPRAATLATESELRRLAEGRAKTVELVGRAGSTDLAGLEGAWDPPPAPAELADWIASLVADGTLGATLGDDGVARFCLAEGRPSAPRPTVDLQELERSLRRRDEALADDGDGPGPS